MARRRKPTDPAAQARKSQERRDIEAEIARMEGQGATVTTDRTGRIVSAYRSNVFNLLLARGSITTNHHDAASRLAEDWATWKGMDGRQDAGAKVDCGSSQPHTRALVTDRMVRAGKDVAWALAGIPQPHRSLLKAFMVATVEEDRPMSWRGVVERVLNIGPGKTHNAAYDLQLRAVVFMLDGLAAMTQAPRERRAAA